MESLPVTKLSTKGQVVIPEEVRRRLGLTPGTRFIVLAEAGAVVFKTIRRPDPKELAALLRSARRAAKRVGITKRDVSRAVAAVRHDSANGRRRRAA